MSVEALAYGTFASPIGLIEVAATERAVVSLRFVEAARQEEHGVVARSNSTVEAALAQLEAYFAGARRVFDLVLAPRGTQFQRQVWQAVQTVPYAGTVSYATIATAIGNPRATRAVGAANGANPVPILVPCHRILGSDGALTGYGGGLWRKVWLLEHEATHG
jgi:methylated-DNA-[protein]-cysteine S-methyltransferase